MALNSPSRTTPPGRLRLAVTGYVSAEAGSVASANALLLRALLQRGCEVVFFSKASFVDPRPSVGDAHPGFHFVDANNRVFDTLRRRFAGIPVLGFIFGVLDTLTYHCLLLRLIRNEHQRQPFDRVVWLGEYARGRIRGVPTISFAQGPPGTDARSLLRRLPEIRALAGRVAAWKWEALARARLSILGRPPLRFTDHFVVGSSQSQQTLHREYGIPNTRITTLPYPMDLDVFRPAPHTPRQGDASEFHALWLGRIVPRKRLDVFLDGAAAAIRRGQNLRITIAGRVGFIPGYEHLIASFPFPDRLTWIRAVPRKDVPALLAQHDVLVQPSEEENFGSSVAEAQACGLPVIVGPTNGNADYLSSRDIRLKDDSPETLADALITIADARHPDDPGGPAISRKLAESEFALAAVADKFLNVLDNAITGRIKIVLVMPSGVYRGGAEEALLHFCRAVKDADIRVIFLESGDLVQRLQEVGATVEVLDAGRLRHPIRVVRAIARIAKTLRSDNPDVVLSWMVKGHLYAGLAARLVGIPAVYFQMGLPDRGIVDRLSRWVPAAGALACSEFAAQCQRQHARHPVLAVPLAADQERFANASKIPPQEMKARLGFDPHRPLIGTVARLQEWKGLHVFAEAMARVFQEAPDCQAVIVGGPHHLEPDYPALLEKKIASLGLTGRIRLAGAQTNVPDWMQAMDVVVHASREEPFGIVVVEAMSLGKPVVATRPGGPEEIVQDGQDGLLVPHGDATAMAKAILRHLRDPAFATACAKAARKSSTQFSPEQFAQNLTQALRKLCSTN